VAIFKDAFQKIFDNIAASVGALAQPALLAIICRRIQKNVRRMAEMLQHVQSETGISMFTIVDLEAEWSFAAIILKRTATIA
jgi:hypothetical protein